MELRLNLDGRRRINLAKFLPELNVRSVRAYTEGDRIILEPLAEIPASKLWLYDSPEALKSVQTGLKQSKEGKIRSKGSFAKYGEDAQKEALRQCYLQANADEGQLEATDEWQGTLGDGADEW